MTGWYVLRTNPGKELEGERLIKDKIPHILWESCRILWKEKIFLLNKGEKILQREILFPGNLFLKTGHPAEVKLFNRRQDILFGICLQGDQVRLPQSH